MQQTEHRIETDGAKITALDADGNGQFIALTETGEVIAHDFRAAIKRVRHRSPLEFRRPIIRRLDQDRFLIANSRTRGWSNGKVFDLDGKELDSLYLGDAIEDILVFSDKIVVMYHEEGVYSGDSPNSSGIAALSFDGKQLWGFNDLIGEKTIPEEAMIGDGGPICRNGEYSVFFFSYIFNPHLTELDLRNFDLKFVPIPERVRFATSFSPVDKNEIIFHRPPSAYPEPDNEKFFWWDRWSNDLEELPEKVPDWITGIEGGRFLARKDFGYTIIDPLALSIKETLQIGSRRLELVLDDITNQQVDAIVNAANSQLAGGFGVDGAIHRRGGTAIMEETREKFPFGCQTGSAVPSNAGKLNAKYVFHAVGPRWFDDPERFDLLRSSYQRCMELGVELNCRSIAFPSISTGDFGFPVKESSVVAIETVCEFLRTLPLESPLEFVRFCLFSEKDLDNYRVAVDSCRGRFENVK